MAITPLYNPEQLARILRQRMVQIETAIINRLSYVGEQCVNHARENGMYMDRTGNLRNSIGYVVFCKGVPVKDDFQEVTTGTTDSDINAEETGYQYALKVAKAMNIENDYMLVVVAGMDYASHVESTGRDVLQGAENLAMELIPRMLRQLKKNIEKSLV